MSEALACTASSKMDCKVSPRGLRWHHRGGQVGQIKRILAQFLFQLPKAGYLFRLSVSHIQRIQQLAFPHYGQRDGLVQRLTSSS